jgi:citronellol/citronellal dehydrogenase
MNDRRLRRISNHIAPAATGGWTAVYKSEEPQPAMAHRSLRGLTLFITGASRGIGLAIALRAAQDGANIVIAAKSATEDARIPGTIYSAAKQVEAAGGRALPIAVDIRSEAAVEAAVAQAVAHFGGIDILINNASAISLTGTADTAMKRYDLMHSVNARGTFMVTQKCLPHLQKSVHAHVLNISPPLNMMTKWFAPHCAYTMAKYGMRPAMFITPAIALADPFQGMSMCVLGMAGEFADSSIAVNALWPRTAIDTAAVQNLLGGGEVVQHSRSPAIMADSAWWVVCDFFPLQALPHFATGLYLRASRRRALAISSSMTKCWLPRTFMI